MQGYDLRVCLDEVFLKENVFFERMSIDLA